MVVAFDVFEDLLSGFVVIVERRLFEGFTFEGGEKALRRRVVPAVVFGTHALSDAELSETLTKFATRILDSAVRMKDGVVHGWLLGARHVQRV